MVALYIPLIGLLLFFRDYDVDDEDEDDDDDEHRPSKDKLLLNINLLWLSRHMRCGCHR